MNQQNPLINPDFLPMRGMYLMEPVINEWTNCPLTELEQDILSRDYAYWSECNVPIEPEKNRLN